MKRLLLILAIVLCAAPAVVGAADKAEGKGPIRALLVTGGCCHDYARQKLILTRGISARADVIWTVVHQGGSTTDTKIPLYEDADWAEGFDVVVHNECFANVRDVEWVERVLKPHRDGTPAVLIHCAMHCYRTGTDKWFEMVGMQSPGHGAHYGYTVDNVKPDHPIMVGFGDKWTTAQGELYHSMRVWPGATPLASAKRRTDGKPQVCVWTNQYNKGRVFGTTIGHHNETMVEPTYLDMVTRGLLWATGRDTEKDFRETNKKTDTQIKALLGVQVDNNKPSPKTSSQPCCGAGNLVSAGKAKASSEETPKKNLAANAIDGDLGTRWCAANANPNQSWQVDLGQSQSIGSLRIHWEHGRVAYRYKIDASADGQTWNTIVDASENKQKRRVMPHKVDNVEARHLRVTFLGSSTGAWGSFWEFEAHEGELPSLPKSTAPKVSGSDATIDDVKAPEGFNVTLFGKPPLVNYPVCLSAAPTGELFVGVDEQGSLGKDPDGGKVLRCIDTDGDGKADRINVFAKVEHPRGLIYDNGSLWVLHTPTLSVFHDDDRDGVADRHDTLVTGISVDALIARKGADHTTNGIRMGIDGWIYIAVGDFGVTEAKGADGTTICRRGGGVIRVRPDGTEMEIFSWGQRNILDVCIDPQMNLFTRDNTNDGGGWDTRVSHVIQSANYGYPSLYMNFSDEIMPPLGMYGGGSGCGGMFLHDLRWPESYGNALYTCDWGTSIVYRHNLAASGPSFAPHQEEFIKIPRPTDIDVDGSGRMYVSSWKNGQFKYDGPNIGFVAQITPKDFVPKPFPILGRESDASLIEYLRSPSAVYRLHSQREILRRGQSEQRTASLVALAADGQTPLYGRVAAIFTLKQLNGVAVRANLLRLAKDDTVREFALRALTDRKTELDGVKATSLTGALADTNPRVQAQALISLGRLGVTAAAEAILPLTSRATDSTPPTAKPFHAQADAGRVVPHLAVKALVAINAVEPCLVALSGPHRDGALSALRYLHDEKAVTGLIQNLNQTRDNAKRREILATLVRLYHLEGEYKADWWGTRPDSSGPYYRRTKWAQSDRIGNVIRVAAGDADSETGDFIGEQLALHKVKIEGLEGGVSIADSSSDSSEEVAITLREIDKSNPNLIANLPATEVAPRVMKAKGDAEAGKALFTQQSCISCHTFQDGQTPKGPHLVDISKRYKPAELIESLVTPSAKIAQGFDTFAFVTVDGKVLTGFVVSESAEQVEIRQADGLSVLLHKEDIDERVKQPISMMPDGVVGGLTPEQLADLLAYLGTFH